jgi:predicted house-cleaning NTP pyrophosphatase (Maf/HAM1 superfamily)
MTEALWENRAITSTPSRNCAAPRASRSFCIPGFPWSGRTQSDVVPFSVVFRRLSESQIESYLQKEQPYDCTGSVKVDGLGVALLERFEGDDPNALIGLPLIRLVRMLENEGVKLL